MSQHVQNSNVSTAEEILLAFHLKPYGVLGQQLTATKKFIDVAPFPAAIPGLVFVDPAGLHHIQGAFKEGVWVDGGPRNAHGAAGAIYKAIGISEDPLFPQDVRDSVKKTGDAKYHKYVKRSQDEDDGTDVLVIHCVGPDFRKDHPETKTKYTRDQAVEGLVNAYKNVLVEFLKSGMPAIRLLPISGGIFSGEFLPQLPAITYEALLGAIMSLEKVQTVELKRRDVEFCLFMEKELIEFMSAGFTFNPPEALDFVKGIPLKPYGVLGQRLTTDLSIEDMAAFPAAIPGLVFVDPAGLHHIKPPGGPRSARGAAGAIYKAIGISEDEKFPDDVIEAMTHGGDAAFHRYINEEEGGAEFLVIHSIGPDFRKKFPGTESSYTRSQAVEALGRSYGNILSEFVRSDQPAMRLLPLSGGIHAGDFLNQIPTLTWEALQIGFWYLGPGERAAVHARNIDLCVFAEKEMAGFERAGFSPHANNNAHLMYQGYAEKAAAAAKSALSVSAAGGGTSIGAKAVNFKGGAEEIDTSSASSPPMFGSGGGGRKSFRRTSSLEEDYAEYYFGPISKQVSVFASAMSAMSGVLGLRKKGGAAHGADPTLVSEQTDWDGVDEGDSWGHAGPVTESMFAFGIKRNPGK